MRRDHIGHSRLEHFGKWYTIPGMIKAIALEGGAPLPLSLRSSLRGLLKIAKGFLQPPAQRERQSLPPQTKRG
jgi:hypothetical protein